MAERRGTRRWWIAAAIAMIPGSAVAADLPRPAHVVVVIEENHSLGEIIGNPNAPYLNRLAREGALFTRAAGVAHPSEPNYLALFSGTTHGVTDDACRYRFNGPNLATALRRAGLSFSSYAESMPAAGFTGCHHGAYARKHNPVVNWQGRTLPASLNRPFSAFPADFARLPTLSLVVPNQRNDMHSGSVARADRWLERQIGPYLRWAQRHDSLLIVTWDEGYGEHNHIPLLFVGPMVRPGRYARPVDHYTVLRTLTDMYGLAPLGRAAERRAITAPWR